MSPQGLGARLAAECLKRRHDSEESKLALSGAPPGRPRPYV